MTEWPRPMAARARVHYTPEDRRGHKSITTHIAEWLANHKVEPSSLYGNGQAATRVVDELIAAYLDFAKSYYVKNGALPEHHSIAGASGGSTTQSSNLPPHFKLAFIMKL